MSIKQVFGSAMEAVFGNSQMKPNPNQPAPTNNLQDPPNTQTQTTPVTAPNGVIPEGGNEPSPLKQFETVWQTPVEDPNKQNGPAPLTSEQMLEAASKVDFTKVLDQSMLQKITAGGEEAVQALAQILNKQSQTVYGQSTVVAQKLIEKAVSDAEARFTAQIPTLVKKQSLREATALENPAFNNPAVAPFIQAFQSQLAEKFPQASTAELQKMSKEYFLGAAEIFKPTPRTTQTEAQKGVDWDEYLSN